VDARAVEETPERGIDSPEDIPVCLQRHGLPSVTVAQSYDSSWVQPPVKVNLWKHSRRLRLEGFDIFAALPSHGHEYVLLIVFGILDWVVVSLLFIAYAIHNLFCVSPLRLFFYLPHGSANEVAFSYYTGSFPGCEELCGALSKAILRRRVYKRLWAAGCSKSFLIRTHTYRTDNPLSLELHISTSTRLSDR